MATTPTLNSTYCSGSFGVVSYNDPKWGKWAPEYAIELIAISKYCLEGPMQNLPIVNNTWSSQFTWSYAWCPDCNGMISCIMDTIPGSLQTRFASAQVILGLTPTLLSSIAPSIGEIAMLSSNRPLLSLLLSLGGPAIFCFRTLTYDDPLSILSPSHTVFTWTPLRMKGYKAYAISISEYLLALVAIWNVVDTSWDLGNRTIVSWRCDMYFLPFTWAMMAGVVHIVASVAWQFSKTMRAIRAAEASSNEGKRVRSNWYWMAEIWYWIKNDVTPCAARAKRGFFQHHEQNLFFLVVFCNVLGQFAAFILVVYGTLLLSSLQFIGTRDSLVTVSRYLGSSIICRLILMFEIAGILAVENP